MSKLDAAIYLLIMLTMLALGLVLSDDSSRKEEVRNAQATVDAKQDIRLEQLEKEVRLLKTDVRLLQHGYEETE